MLLTAPGEQVFSRGTGEVSSDRVLAEMAAKNFPVNLKIFSDMVNELYLTTVDIDKQMNKNKKPTFEKIPELKNLGKYLVEGE